jgi:hypothetical protein
MTQIDRMTIKQQKIIRVKGPTITGYRINTEQPRVTKKDNK